MPDEDYAAAVEGLAPFVYFNQSTVSIVVVELKNIKRNANEEVKVKVASTNFFSRNSSDDFLGNNEKGWSTLALSEGAQGFFNLPLSVNFPNQSKQELVVKRGFGKEKLLLLIPTNMSTLGVKVRDNQSLIIK